jgi:hypothetical protein
MTRISIARADNPKQRIVITHEDLGDTMPLALPDGAERPAWTSRWTIDGVAELVQVDAEATHLSERRLVEDMSFLTARGLDNCDWRVVT